MAASAPLPYPAFDVDNHYYEAEDAFTRHIDQAMARRAVQWVELRGRKRILVAGKLDRFLPNPSFDPVTTPGALEAYFRGENRDGKTMAELFAGKIEPIRPEYRDREARLACMEKQGLEAIVLFPTLGCGIEQPLRHDAEATHAALDAFNRWLDEDWGFNHRDKIYAVPMLTLMDVDTAVKQLEWVLARGARMVHLRPAPVPKGDRSVSPGDPTHDSFWARVNEAGIPVAFHAGDSGYGRYVAAWEGPRPMEGFRGGNTFAMATLPGRAVLDTMAALICHGVFDRFPNVRVASIENGGFWVPWLFKNLRKAHGQMPSLFGEDPIESFRRHVYVAPYFEDDARELADLIGVAHVLFGSDFPHAEGLPAPLDYLDDLRDFSGDEIRRIMRDNQHELLTPRPL